MSFVANAAAQSSRQAVHQMCNLEMVKAALRRGEKELTSKNEDTVTMIFCLQIAYKVKADDYEQLDQSEKRRLNAIEAEAYKFVKYNPKSLLAEPFRKELQACIDYCNDHFDRSRKYKAIDELLSEFYETRKEAYLNDGNPLQFRLNCVSELAHPVLYGETFQFLIRYRAVTIPQVMNDACNGEIGEFGPG